MFVCVCKAVSDRQIRRAVREEGIVSLRELTREYGLGTCCGKCVPAAREVLGDALQSLPSAQIAVGLSMNDATVAAA